MNPTIHRFPETFLESRIASVLRSPHYSNLINEDGYRLRADDESIMVMSLAEFVGYGQPLREDGLPEHDLRRKALRPFREALREATEEEYTHGTRVWSAPQFGWITLRRVFERPSRSHEHLPQPTP